MEILNKNRRPFGVDKCDPAAAAFDPLGAGLQTARKVPLVQAIGEIRGEEGELGRRDGSRLPSPPVLPSDRKADRLQNVTTGVAHFDTPVAGPLW